MIVWPSHEGKSQGLWLWNRPIDMTVVAGGGFFLFAAVAVPLTYAWAGFGPAIITLFAHLGVAVNYPHYAATYELAYRERRRQTRTWNLMFWSLPVLLAMTVAGIVYDRYLLSPLVRLYLTWSAYHYAKQHFGLAAMYQARARTPLMPAEKLPLQVSFVGVGVFQMVTVNMWGADPVVRSYGDPNTVKLLAVLPTTIYPLAIFVLIVSMLALAYAQLRLKKRVGKGFVSPVWLLALTNVAWFVVPNVWIPWGAPGPWLHPALALWIPIAIPFFHCAQYLGVTTHRARSTSAVRPVFLLVALMILGLVLFEATATVITKASWLVEQRALVLMASLVNIHHFWLDGLMWKRPKPAKTKTPVTVTDGAVVSARVAE
jgi:hypothetical protein